MVIKAVSARSSLANVLRAYRAEQAYMQAMPAMNVFGDKVLKSIVSHRPATLKQLQSIKGIGASRQAKYGADIIRMVNMSKKRCPRKVPRGAGEKVVLSRFFAAPAAQREEPKEEKPSLAEQLCEVVKDPITELRRPKPRPRPVPKPRPKPPKDEEASVYILELAQGRVYVGSSRNVQQRVAQHMAGTGSAYTRVYKPTGVLLPRLGNVGGEGDAAERDETLRYMMLRGIPYVRGWKFSQVVMTPDEFDEAEANIREAFDLCRKCGYKGHFMTQCRATYDRWGQEIGGKKA